MNCQHSRRRGYLIGEMIVTGALLSLAAALATSMMLKLFETGYSLQTSEQAGLSADAAVTQLRRDVETAVVGPMKDGLLTTDSSQWTVRDDRLIRLRAGLPEQSYGPLATPIELESNAGLVRLRIGQAHWTFAQLNPTGVDPWP